jgi:hypothetical protein
MVARVSISLSMQWYICVILVPEIWFFGTIVVQEVDKILTKHKSWESLPVWVKCCYYIMEASYEDDDLFSLVNCNLTSWLLQTYYGFQLLFVAWYVAKMLWLRFCDVAWDAMIFGVCEIWARAECVAIFGLWESHHFPGSYEYVLMTH